MFELRLGGKFNEQDRISCSNCKENRIVGAMRMSRIWIIPEDAQKPTNSKRTSNKTGGKKFAATHSV